MQTTTVRPSQGPRPGRTWPRALAAAAAVLLALVGPLVVAAPARAADQVITITADGVSPPALTIAPGDSISFVNLDRSLLYRAVSTSENWKLDSGVLGLLPGQRFTVPAGAVSGPGTYTYRVAEGEAFQGSVVLPPARPTAGPPSTSSPPVTTGPAAGTRPAPAPAPAPVSSPTSGQSLSAANGPPAGRAPAAGAGAPAGRGSPAGPAPAAGTGPAAGPAPAAGTGPAAGPVPASGPGPTSAQSPTGGAAANPGGPGAGPSPTPGGGSGAAVLPPLTGGSSAAGGAALPGGTAQLPELAPGVAGVPAPTTGPAPQVAGPPAVATAAAPALRGALPAGTTARRYGLPTALAAVLVLGVASLLVRVLLAEPVGHVATARPRRPFRAHAVPAGAH